MMRVLVTGVKGQLGYDVVKRFKHIGIDAIGVDVDDFDLTNREQTKSYINDLNPDAVIHCAAYTAVDKAEEDKELCYKVNVMGTRYIAEACKDINAKMIYISTDYVFEGGKEFPLEVNDSKNPQNIYGFTKYCGELEVKDILEKYFIVRISWVFGVNGKNFVKTMLRLSETMQEIGVVCDQIGSPTYTKDLAVLLCEMIQTDKYGEYHATNEGFCSWYDFACEIFKYANINIKVKEVKTLDYKTAATRPLNSRMSKKSLDENGFDRLPSWQDSLKEYLNEIQK